MIGKPSGPVRREAARKRVCPTGTSPRGRPIRLAGPIPSPQQGLRVPPGDLRGRDLPGHEPAAGPPAGRWPDPDPPAPAGQAGDWAWVQWQPRRRSHAPSRPGLIITPRVPASQAASWPAVQAWSWRAARRSSASTAAKSCSLSLGGRPQRGRSGSAPSPPCTNRLSVRRTVASQTPSCAASRGTAQPWSARRMHSSRRRVRSASVGWSSRRYSAARWSAARSIRSGWARRQRPPLPAHLQPSSSQLPAFQTPSSCGRRPRGRRPTGRRCARAGPGPAPPRR
jgi:hypothetical protein